MTQSRFNAFSLSHAEARHRGAATLAAVALAFVSAGCGGGGGGGGGQLSRSDYEKHLTSDSQAISKGLKPLTTPPTSMTELTDELKAAEAQLHDAAEDLDGVTPPKDIEKDNNAVVKGLRKFADELKSFRKAAEKNDPQLLRKTFGELQSSHALVDVRNATNDMKKKGYKLTALPQ
jgi:hypothetical protein